MIRWLGGDFVFNGFARCQLWFDNPNKAAVLFAEIALIGAFLAGCRRPGLRFLGVATFTAAALPLLLTFSRGGAVALILGLLVAGPHWIGKNHGRRLWLVGCLALFICMMALTVRIGFAERMWLGFSGCDRSVVNRLELWQKVPQMIHDAPWGWGVGRSGEAYMQWYQPLERSERYRTLVNSHLTMIAELGVVGGLGWVFLWSFLLGSGTGFARRCGSWLCLSEWLTLFVAGIFSTVCEEWSLWVVPVLVQTVEISRFPRTMVASLSSRRSLWFHGLTLGGYVTCVVWAMTICPESGICKRAGRISVGVYGPKIWLVPDGDVLGGSLYGREIRRFQQNGGMVTFVIEEEAGRIPSNAEYVVLCGESCSPGVRGRKKTIWLSPSFLESAKGACDVVVVGEFACDREVCGTHAVVVDGVANFIPNWVKIVSDLCAKKTF